MTASASTRRRPRGIGLRNLVERAAAMNGMLAVDTAPGRGTAIRLRIPLSASSLS